MTTADRTPEVAKPSLDGSGGGIHREIPGLYAGLPSLNDRQVGGSLQLNDLQIVDNGATPGPKTPGGTMTETVTGTRAPHEIGPKFPGGTMTETITGTRPGSAAGETSRVEPSVPQTHGEGHAFGNPVQTSSGEGTRSSDSHGEGSTTGDRSGSSHGEGSATGDRSSTGDNVCTIDNPRGEGGGRGMPYDPSAGFSNFELTSERVASAAGAGAAEGAAGSADDAAASSASGSADRNSSTPSNRHNPNDERREIPKSEGFGTPQPGADQDGAQPPAPVRGRAAADAAPSTSGRTGLARDGARDAAAAAGGVGTGYPATAGDPRPASSGDVRPAYGMSFPVVAP